jgi:hypothetical protein
MATDTPGFVITQEIIDEFLEAQWLLDEQGKSHAIKRSALPAIVIDEGVIEDAQKAAMVIEKMAKDGYISISGDDIAFTDRGRETAKNLTRRKRLAEKLLAEVLALGPSEIKSSACRFEHILSPEVTDSVCAFLGHPPTCPHGKPNPARGLLQSSRTT